MSSILTVTDVKDILSDLGIICIDRGMDTLFLCRINRPSYNEVCVMIARHGEVWHIRRHDGNSPGGWLSKVGDVFDLQDWLINEFDKYRA